MTSAITVNGIEIAYDFHGPADGPLLLLIQGLSMPSTAWPPLLLDYLGGQGFRVLTFDNRDIGRSQRLDHERPPNLVLQLARRAMHLRVRSPYQLTDMMRDTESLLAALELPPVHVVGASMGGMIAQLLAIHAPGRVRSLVSLMSTTGRRGLPGPTREVSRHIMRGPADLSTESRLAYQRKLWSLLGSPRYPVDAEELNAFLTRIAERGMTAAGTRRQTLAIVASPSRVGDLARLQTPTLVIHGDADPLIPVACGRDTARAIPGAREVIIEGMGHDLPSSLVPRLGELITGHARAAEAAAANGTGDAPTASRAGVDD